MKILFLLPPSEGKNWENKYDLEKCSFNFIKPIKIAQNVTEKDLKCIWKRFEEWIKLNNNIEHSSTIEVVERYTWVMYNSIDYSWMKEDWKRFFEDNFLIFSWMYWILKPLDRIWNYKLPIETKWLYSFWWDKIVSSINDLKVDYVVNLLPISYSKMILWVNKKQEVIFNDKRKFKVININFLKSDGKKISHWVKKIKWEWIKKICEQQITNYKDFWWNIIKKEDFIDINIIY